jgi:hypothetical protein
MARLHILLGESNLLMLLNFLSFPFPGEVEKGVLPKQAVDVAPILQ